MKIGGRSMKKSIVNVIVMATIALAGCMEQGAFEAYSPVPNGSYGTYMSPLEISVGDNLTKSFDENLVWSWEKFDEICGYQVAGTNAVNTLTFVENNRFGTPEFAYSTSNPATFHFIYVGDNAVVDRTAFGNRGIKQSSRQSGEWDPVLVGSVENETFANVINEGTTITMEHLSAALEVRLWRTGVDKNNMTDADRKNIVYAELMSNSENFLLDVVPSYELDGSVIYNTRPRGSDEEIGSYVRTEDINGPVAVFNIAPHEANYNAGDLRLAIVDENDDRYVLDVPAVNFLAGKRTVINVEWQTPTTVYLPDGESFNGLVCDFMERNLGISKIQFITNSAVTSPDIIVSGVYMVANGVTLEIHTAADQYMANENCECMFDFDGDDGIEYIEFSNFNTGNVVNMEGMFSCETLRSIDLSGFNTSNVTNMKYLFTDCAVLEKIDLKNFSTSNVRDMSCMFMRCGSLSSIDLSNFDTRKVEDLSSMFEDCSTLSDLNISSFNTSYVVDMTFMFEGCSLSNIDLGHFNTSSVKDFQGMFMDCSNLTSVNVSSFNINSDSDIDEMFCGCEKLTSLDLTSFTFYENTWVARMFRDVGRSATSKPIPIYVTASGKAYLEEEETRINYEYAQYVVDSDKAYLPAGEVFNSIVGNYLGSNPNITRIKFIANSNVTSSDKIVEDNIFMVSNGGTLEIHTPAEEFIANASCKRMFSFLEYEIESIDFGAHFNTSTVTDMGSMFAGNDSLNGLDLSCFRTENVQDMHGIFAHCYSLASLEISSFDTRNVNDMSTMFYNCRSLKTLNLDNFNTSNVVDMASMFCACRELELISISNFNTSKVQTMYAMFAGCNILPQLDIKHFNTSNVKRMDSMFYKCSNLAFLDISSFSFRRIPYIDYMFENTGSNAVNRPISIYVSSAGKKYIEGVDSDGDDSNDTLINDLYAKLVVKN